MTLILGIAVGGTVVVAFSALGMFWVSQRGYKGVL